jgi:hypothetical protein
VCLGVRYFASCPYLTPEERKATRYRLTHLERISEFLRDLGDALEANMDIFTSALEENRTAVSSGCVHASRDRMEIGTLLDLTMQKVTSAMQHNTVHSKEANEALMDIERMSVDLENASLGLTEEVCKDLSERLMEDRAKILG